MQLSLPSRSLRRLRCVSSTPGSGLVADYASTGIAIGEHPMALLRAELRRGDGLERRSDAPGRRPARGGRGDGGRPPAAGDCPRRGLHVARGRAGRDQRGRSTPVYAGSSARGEDGGVHDRRAAGWSVAPGWSTWWPGPGARSPRRSSRPRQVRHDRAAHRARDGPLEPRRANRGRRLPAPARRTPTTHGSWPPWRRQRTASAGVGGEAGCAISVAEPCSVWAPTLASRPMLHGRNRIGQHLISGVDLAIDFATLGEYGLEPQSRGRVLSRTSRPAIPTWSPARMGGVRDGPPRRLCNVVPA